MVISIAEIKMTRAIHLCPLGDHLISSGHQEEIFLARQKASYNSLQLVPYTHFPLSDPAGVGCSWCGILLFYSNFSPSHHCPFFYLLPVSMSLSANTFQGHWYSLLTHLLFPDLSIKLSIYSLKQKFTNPLKLFTKFQIHICVYIF